MHWTHRLDRGPHGGPKEVLWRLSHHNQEQLGSAVALSCFHFWATASLAAQSGPCASARLGVRGAPSRICCPLPCPPRSRATPRRAWNLTWSLAVTKPENLQSKRWRKAGTSICRRPARKIRGSCTRMTATRHCGGRGSLSSPVHAWPLLAGS